MSGIRVIQVALLLALLTVSCFAAPKEVVTSNLVPEVVTALEVEKREYGLKRFFSYHLNSIDIVWFSLLEIGSTRTQCTL